jgi:hypothetical protein
MHEQGHGFNPKYQKKKKEKKFLSVSVSLSLLSLFQVGAHASKPCTRETKAGEL